MRIPNTTELQALKRLKWPILCHITLHDTNISDIEDKAWHKPWDAWEGKASYKALREGD